MGSAARVAFLLSATLPERMAIVSQSAPQPPVTKPPNAFSQLLIALAARIAPKVKTQNTQDVKQETVLERYRREIDSFEEDREELGAKLVRKSFTFVAYVVPFLIAFFIGREIGDYYSGPLNLDDGWSGGMHIAAWGGEAALGMMVISTARAWRQFKKDPGSESWLFASGFFFIALTLASCFAQWVIADNHIHPNVFNNYAALIFRVAMPTGADIAAMLWLGIMRYKSLKQYLTERQQKAQAIQLLSEVEITIQEAEQSAARRNQQAEQALLMQQKFSDLVLQISEISGEGMVSLAKLAMQREPSFRLLTDTSPNGVHPTTNQDPAENKAVLE
jgi:hypothetical protein